MDAVFLQKLENGDADALERINVSLENMHVPEHDKFLSEVQDHPSNWKAAVMLLSRGHTDMVRIFGARVLIKNIKTSWYSLDDNQKQAIVSLLLECSNREAARQGGRGDSVLLMMTNLALVEVVKRVWPNAWTNFIEELCDNARADETLVDNYVRILSLLGQEVFEFGNENMTTRMVRERRVAMQAQFPKVLELCMLIFKNYSEKPRSITDSLLLQSLNCFSQFIRWVPPALIFNNEVLHVIFTTFWNVHQFREECLRCIVQMAGTPAQDEATREGLGKLYNLLIGGLTLLHPDTFNGHERNGGFYMQLSLALTCFLREQLEPVLLASTRADNWKPIQFGFETLNRLLKTNHSESGKICIEFWHTFSEKLLREVHQEAETLGRLKYRQDRMVEPLENPEAYSHTLRTFQPHLTEVRLYIITNMAKPKEVYVNFDSETLTASKENIANTQEVAQYQLMRDTLVMLTHLKPDDTQNIMSSILDSERQQDHNVAANWDPSRLSCLCWSIGCVSGAFPSTTEQHFVFKVIKELLRLVEVKKSRDSKAVVASQLMHVVGHYPTFLTLNLKFLCAVIEKLLGFAQEDYAGVQEMACDTLVTICQACGDALHKDQDGTGTPAAKYIVDTEHLMARISTSGLTQRIQIYEAMGHVIETAPRELAPEYMLRLLANPVSVWGLLVEAAKTNDTRVADLVPQGTEVLKIFERTAKAAGLSFAHQFTIIYESLIEMHGYFTKRMIAEMRGTPEKSAFVSKHVRLCRKGCLTVVHTFVDSSASSGDQIRQEIADRIINHLVNILLLEYLECTAEVRDSEIITLVTSLIRSLGRNIPPEAINACMLRLFDPTVDMLRTDQTTYLDHRAAFFDFLKALTETVPECIKQSDRVSPYQQILAFGASHDNPSIASVSLDTFLRYFEFIDKSPDAVRDYCGQYFTTVFPIILDVTTDTVHKACFKQQIQVLRKLLQMQLSLGMTEETTMSAVSQAILRQHPTLNIRQCDVFLLTMVTRANQSEDLFKDAVHDFLIVSKELYGDEAWLEIERAEALEEAERQNIMRRRTIAGYQGGTH